MLILNFDGEKILVIEHENKSILWNGSNRYSIRVSTDLLNDMFPDFRQKAENIIRNICYCDRRNFSYSFFKKKDHITIEQWEQTETELNLLWEKQELALALMEEPSIKLL